MLQENIAGKHKYDQMRTALCLLLLCLVTFMACRQDPDPETRKIRQSVKLHDDNVNGSDLRIQNISIREASYFSYNNSGQLDSVTVYSDTSSAAILIKTLKVDYQSNKIRVRAYEVTSGLITLDFYYNSKKQLLKMVDTSGMDLYGFFFTYSQDQLTDISIVLGSTTHITNFVYDSNNNLVQYVMPDSNNLPIKVNFEYDTKSIPTDLDIRFANGGIRFLYIGGTNIISLLGLNTGLGNSNRIIRRTETNLSSGTTIADYLFHYNENNNREITGRKVIINDTIDVFYEYRY